MATPILFGVATVLNRYVEHGSAPYALVRPILVTSLLAIGLVLLARVLLRSWAWASLAASAVVLFTLREAVLAGAIAAFALWFLLVRTLRAVRRESLPDARIVRGVASVVAVVSLVLTILSEGSALVASVERPPTAVPGYSLTGREAPSIYLILLDGYPRADSLANTFGIDNSQFTEALEAMGFAVANEARSNYNKTWLTVASMLNGAYINDLLEGGDLPSTDAGQIRWLHSLIDQAAIPRALRGAGYRIRTIAPFFTSAGLTSADDFVDHGHLTELEASLILGSPW